MSQLVLKAERRTGTGKEKAKKLRRDGKFPAIVYGTTKEPVSLELNIRDMEAVLAKIHGEKVLVTLEHGDTAESVFIRNVQRDPVKNKLIHADFYRVDMTQEIVTKVPVVAVGTAEGVKFGGLLEPVVRAVEVRALPGNVPPHINVNVEKLQVGQSIHVRDLPPIDGVKFITQPDAVLFLIAGRQKEETPAAAAAAPAAS
jgi:large subunit ribosomal protein L25